MLPFELSGDPIMLYKDLISKYGSSLAAKSAPKDDPVWSLGWSEDLQIFPLKFDGIQILFYNDIKG